MSTVIETINLTKQYQAFHAVNNVSLQIKKGEIYGFIGLNGAGKTTLIRMLLGLIKPTSGTCYINGDQVTRTSTHLWSKVGHIVESPHSYPELTVAEVLHIQRKLYAIKDEAVVLQIMAELHLIKYKNVKSKNLSLGNMQRLGIAKALVHRPEILILDEPVNGLDPKGMVDMRHFLKRLVQERNVTILISSHLLSEVAKIATKIGMIHDGILIEEIDITTLHKRLNRRLIIQTNHNQQAVNLLANINIVANFIDDGAIETYDTNVIHQPDIVSQYLVENGLSLSHLSVIEEDLEAYFLRLIQEKERHHHDILS